MVEIHPIAPLIFLIVGLALTFYGRMLLKSVAFLIGAIMGATLAYLLAIQIAPRVDEYISPQICIIIAIIFLTI